MEINNHQILFYFDVWSTLKKNMIIFMERKLEKKDKAQEITGKLYTYLYT